MSTYTRPVMLLLSGLLLLTLAIAVLNTLVPLWLAQEHMSTWQVGVVSSSYFTGNLVGTLLTGYVIKRIGFNRSYYLASFIFAAGCTGLGLMIGFWSWLAWRFVAGVGCAMIWVVVESALMCSGTSRNRTGQQGLNRADERIAVGYRFDIGRDLTAVVYACPESAG